MKSRVNWPMLCLIVSVLLQTLAAVLVKLAAIESGEFSLISVLSNVYYVAMVGCLGLQAIAWQVALRKYPLSFAYFITSVLPINILIVSYFGFGETVSAGNILGCFIVVAGLVVLTRDTEVEAGA